MKRAVQSLSDCCHALALHLFCVIGLSSTVASTLRVRARGASLSTTISRISIALVLAITQEVAGSAAVPALILLQEALACRRSGSRAVVAAAAIGLATVTPATRAEERVGLSALRARSGEE